MKRICFVLSVAAGWLCLWPSPAHASQIGPFPDFDGNGVVDFPDFLQFAGKFGSEQGDDTYEVRFDLDGDGAIGFSDFLIFAIRGKLSEEVVRSAYASYAESSRSD